MLKSSLYLNSFLFNKKGKWVALSFFISFGCNSQISNYVSNGGFEKVINCNGNAKVSNSKNWDEIDNGQASVYCQPCFSNTPYNSFGFQYPKRGSAYAIADFLAVTSPPGARTYLRNKLITNLVAGTKYCLRFYVNIGNNSTYGISSIGAYLGDNNLDTIKHGHIPLTYLTPQVQNPNNNIIKDTLNWTPITGTFIASGNEKYLVIGNFVSDASTNKLFINPTNTPAIFCTVSVDDVSCIPIELPAFAGNDTTCIPGSTIYLGRPNDVGIDEACMWYKLPITITPTTPAIDTAAGIWVSPVTTSTYVVRQQLWCSGVKWDTVVVYMDGVGLHEFKKEDLRFKIWPNPADEVLFLRSETIKDGERLTLQISNLMGQIITEKEIEFKAANTKIDIKDLPNGIYFLKVQAENWQAFYKILKE